MHKAEAVAERSRRCMKIRCWTIMERGSHGVIQCTYLLFSSVVQSACCLHTYIFTSQLPLVIIYPSSS